jgi:protein-S-isoprenylcysteine O-methyltransferase Ste14
VKEQRNVWMRWRVRTGYLVAVIYWVLAAPTAASILWGGLVATSGLLIRGAASGHLRKYEELITSGPYARTRNPLYFGSAFLAVGFALAGHSWWAGGVVVAYFAIFYSAVMRNEERDLRARYGAAFDEYASRVPLFFPRVGTGPQARAVGKAFDFAQYRRNREYQALLGTLAGIGIVWVRMWIRRRFGL